MSLVKIPINDATNAQLLFYAQQVVGLDVNKGASNAILRGKIEQAQPGTAEIDVESGSLTAEQAPTQNTPVSSDADDGAETIPAGRLGAHWRYDPKVKVNISQTSDKTRSKDVHIAVNGEVIIVKRGESVSIPYRHYLALRDGVERVGIETDEINPVTHMPIIAWVDRPSYEFSVLSMPSEEEIRAFHERTDDLVTV